MSGPENKGKHQDPANNTSPTRGREGRGRPEGSGVHYKTYPERNRGMLQGDGVSEGTHCCRKGRGGKKTWKMRKGKVFGKQPMA